jgi:hypothetical protein
LLGTVGCGAGLSSRPIKTEAELGRVVIYRNGVAYFERSAVVEDGRLRIAVPAERVDDFLKSLTVVDAETGVTLPVSFKTPEGTGGELEIEIETRGAGRGARKLLLTYVTESPAWKPSYRLKLDDRGRGKLEAWAVIDNVSGEDWQHVEVGVGSTTALSFRYDLHSIRTVERETLSDGPAVAHAPPTGGSPYQVASGEAAVIGNLAHAELDDLRTPRGGDGEARLAGRGGAPRDPKPKVATKATANSPFAGDDRVQSMANQLRSSRQRVRLEGYARPGDKDAKRSSLESANRLRDALIESGVPADQLEVVATGQVSAQAARVLALPEAPKPAQPKSEDTTEPLGTAYFVAPGRMTIEKNRSAMVSVLTSSVAAERVYYYDPISTRGSKKFAFRAVRLENPSEHTLEPGPFTVYAEGQFLGEGLSDPIPPKSSAFVPYALDRELVVDPAAEVREELERLVTIERGIVTAEARRIRRTQVSLVNRGRSDATVYVRHQVPTGWRLTESKQKFEKLRGAYLFPVKVPKRGSLELVIEESQPAVKTLDIHSDGGVKEIGLFLETKRELPPELRAKLSEILKMHREMHDTREKIDTLRAQMGTLRERIDEIHVQLVTLRKVGTAQALSRDLAKKMEEISNRLQKATIEVTDLESRLLTSRITLQDRLADLRLEPPKESDKSAPGPALAGAAGTK